MIGLGLSDERDITLKGLEAVKTCAYIYLECYTAILMVSREKLETLFAKPVIEADRDFVESGCQEMIEQSKTENVAFLVVGDPFCATTHSDLYIRCHESGVKVEVIHNASIVSAVGCCGLQVYRFGEIVSLPFFTEKWRPYSFYDKVKNNREKGLHTLVLLDIKVKEPTEESLARGKKIYMEPRYMRTHQAASQLLEAESVLKQKVYNESTHCFGLARVGTPTQQIVSGTMEEFLKIDMGEPLHSFVICGDMHHIEEEMFKFFLHKKE